MLYEFVIGKTSLFPAIVKKVVEPGRAAKPLAIVPPSTEGRGRSRLTAEEVGGAGLLRRGSSAENVNLQLPAEAQANGNLKRFKSGKEQVCYIFIVNLL